MSKPERDIFCNIELSDEDVLEAMKDIQGYLDITTEDFKELYRVAFRHAVSRVSSQAKAADIMTTQVISVKRDTPLIEVAALLAGKGIAGVPVLENDGSVAGVISEKDFLAEMGGEKTGSFMAVVAECLKGKGCLAVPVRPKKAEDVMSAPAVTVSTDATVREMADVMTGKNINRIPVVDSGGKLVGIVSRADLVSATSRD